MRKGGREGAREGGSKIAREGWKLQGMYPDKGTGQVYNREPGRSSI